jgi:preprotein translocase subunit SecD
MLGTLKGRFAVIAFVALLCAWTIYRNDGVSLGLDLQGGMHLALEIADPDSTLTDDAKAEYIDQVLFVLRNRIDQFGVAEPVIQKSGRTRIIVELPGIDDEERAKQVINDQAFLEWKEVLPSDVLTNAMPRMDRIVAAALVARGETVTADTTQQMTRDIRAQLFGDTASADSAQAGPTQQPLSSLIYGSGQPGEFQVPETSVPRVQEYLALPGVAQALSRNAELAWGADTVGQGAQLYRSLYVLERQPILTGDRLTDATASRDPRFNQTVVNFTLDRRGGRAFDDFTSQHVGDRIAIVLDGVVQSAPVVQSRIGSTGMIEMGAGTPMQVASDLALKLRAGALPVGVEIVDERTVGPSLGQSSIDQGKIAGIIGIGAVILTMILYYRLAGVLAVVALVFYVLFVFGGLSGFGAALTAPGIAGFILSLGMAVDANVLIFERIREELIQGRSTRAAVDAGFQHAMSAIIDSNVTTLITALILYQVGTGPVRGFAVTLSVGIIASFFTAVYITRSFFLLYLSRKRASDPLSI